ncbi:H-NS histone family protein [Falsiroseomonas selenitidurans]|uniref:H-NS histone family protein n=1 Tax=Falsiroseomonas selenitidurans TaxID=2716335 RepID=A0ABX1DZC1_9PROT|nr:H-NS histone family protein [Falsiroseomonas selenitidurans]NKC30254.1 H-NS histone family protein [Falsiroseomonas selenitidurans]
MAEKSAIHLDDLSVADLTALIAAAEEKRQEKMEGAKAALIEEFAQKAAALGLSVEELYGRIGHDAPMPVAKRKPRKDAGRSVAAKYRSPTGATWSGRGRRPGWVTEALARGTDLEAFRV